MDHITPLFIFGMGRSGTTNTLRVLNCHPAVMLNGEISIPVIKQFLKTLDQVEDSYGKREATRDGWYARKAEYMFESFGFLAKGGRGKQHKVENAEYLGHKTPRLESLFDEYEQHFASVGMQPRYFYCARNPYDCWRSYRATTWTKYEQVEQFLNHYMDSFEILERIQPKAGDRLRVLNLDELKAQPDPIAFYVERIFEPLGLNVNERLIARIQKLASDRDARTKPPKMPEADRRTIDAFPGIAALHDRMFAAHIRARQAMPESIPTGA